MAYAYTWNVEPGN